MDICSPKSSQWGANLQGRDTINPVSSELSAGFVAVAVAVHKIKGSGGIWKGCHAYLYFLQWMCCRKFLLTGYYDYFKVHMTSCLENSSNYKLFISILTYVATTLYSTEHLIWSLFFKIVAFWVGVRYYIHWRNIHLFLCVLAFKCFLFGKS